MRLVEGVAEVDSVDDFVASIGDIAGDTGATVQVFDARYVVSRTHLERAVELADRAIGRGENVARDRAVEILLYVAGRRQIDQALTLGVNEGRTPVVALVDGGDEAAAEREVAHLLDPAETLGDYDEQLVRDYFDVDDTELAATTGSLEDAVLERVVLLDVEK